MFSSREIDRPERSNGAVGQVCCLNKVPFIMVRGMSDTAGSNAGETFSEYVELASRNAGRVVVALIDKLQYRNECELMV